MARRRGRRADVMAPVRLAPAAGILPRFDRAATGDASSTWSASSVIFWRSLNTIAAVSARKRLAFRVQPALLWCDHVRFPSIELGAATQLLATVCHAACPAHSHRYGEHPNDQVTASVPGPFQLPMLRASSQAAVPGCCPRLTALIPKNRLIGPAAKSVNSCACVRTRSEPCVTSVASLPAVRVSAQRRGVVHPRGS